MVRKFHVFFFVAVAFLSAVNITSQAQSFSTHHVRDAVRNGSAQHVGQLPADQVMNLDIVLPLRNQAALDSFLSEVHNPSSPSYRHFLTVPQFTEMFGPTQGDYDAVVRFAKINGLTVVGGS